MGTAPTLFRRGSRGLETTAEIGKQRMFLFLHKKWSHCQRHGKTLWNMWPANVSYKDI
jgi:hypothetical protein